MRHLTTTPWALGMLAAITLAAPASAEIVSVTGTLSALATVTDPPDDQPDEATASINLGFDNPGPRQLTLSSPAGSEDEETNILQTFTASPEGFTATGISDSADNRSSFGTAGRMTVAIAFAVDEEALYELNFTKNNDPGEVVTLTFLGSDDPTPLLAFDTQGAGGSVTQLRQYLLGPGVTYTVNALFTSTAGGDGSAQSTTTYLIDLSLVPEPAMGSLLAVGVVLVGRRRRVCDR
ncbi:MAG: hypothetical protein AAF911_11170 [Planctomycetota bacterium]